MLQLNAQGRLQSPFGSGMAEYGTAPPEPVVIRLVSSSIRYGPGDMKEFLESPRKVCLAEAGMWGFEAWVQTKEGVLTEGTGFRQDGSSEERTSLPLMGRHPAYPEPCRPEVSPGE